MSVDRSIQAPPDDVMDPAIAGRGGRRRIPWPLVLLGGLAGGLVWGIHARVWMRFISTDPEFTWAGTLFIVFGFGVAGLAQSAASLGRRADLRRSRLTTVRVATFASLLPLGAAAGGPVFPTIVLAPLALTHAEWSRRTEPFVKRCAFAMIARTAVQDKGAPDALFIAWFPLIEAGATDDRNEVKKAVSWAGFVWFVGVYAGIAWAARFTMAPQRDGWVAPGWLRGVGVAALALVGALELLFLFGPKA